MTDQPSLRTERLVLRPFTLDDALAVQLLAGEPEVSSTTLNLPHPYLDGMAEAWITTHQPEWASGHRVTFAIVTPQDELRGAISIVVSRENAQGELGYWIGRAWWGQGLATEAAAAVLQFAFESLDLNRVQAHHLTRNPASGRVLEKIGMQREGMHRERFRRHDRFEDVIAYAVLRRDWRLPAPGRPL